MPEKILYVTDLDGTLLNSGQTVSAFTERTINALLEKGLLFTCATARSLRSTSVLTRGLSLTLPLVLNNGVFLREPDTGEYRHATVMDTGRIRRVLDILEANSVPALVDSLLNGKERVSWLRGTENPGMITYLGRHLDDPRIRPVDSFSQLIEGEIFYITIIAEEEPAHRIYSLLKGEDYISLNLCNDIYCREEWWVEIYRHDASKASAIDRLRRMIGADKTVCFGDGFNDLPMFRSCDEAYAMANAEPEVKRAATAVIGSNDEDGVAKWLLANAILPE